MRNYLIKIFTPIHLVKNYPDLLAADQLKIEHGAGNVFLGFSEGDIKFPPTYK